MALVALNKKNVSHVRIHNLSDILESPLIIDIRVLELNFPLPFGVDFLGFWEDHIFAMTLISNSTVFHKEVYDIH